MIEFTLTWYSRTLSPLSLAREINKISMYISYITMTKKENRGNFYPWLKFVVIISLVLARNLRIILRVTSVTEGTFTCVAATDSQCTHAVSGIQYMMISIMFSCSVSVSINIIFLYWHRSSGKYSVLHKFLQITDEFPIWLWNSHPCLVHVLSQLWTFHS